MGALTETNPGETKMLSTRPRSRVERRFIRTCIVFVSLHPVFFSFQRLIDRDELRPTNESIPRSFDPGPAAAAARVPYRDSKLTHLLSEALGGNSRTTLITCISPAGVDVAETTSTLRFGERARRVKQTPTANVFGENNGALATARAEVTALRERLARATELLDARRVAVAKTTTTTTTTTTDALVACGGGESGMSEKVPAERPVLFAGFSGATTSATLAFAPRRHGVSSVPSSTLNLTLSLTPTLTVTLTLTLNLTQQVSASRRRPRRPRGASPPSGSS